VLSVDEEYGKNGETLRVFVSSYQHNQMLMTLRPEFEVETPSKRAKMDQPPSK
jgi:hypothetical protein